MISFVQEINDLFQEKAHILIANSFNQNDVIGLRSLFHQAGHFVAYIGLTSGPIYNSLNLPLTPDYTINSLNNWSKKCLLIIPGELPCTKYLLTDARVYRLVLATLKNGGYVAATRQAQEIVGATYHSLVLNSNAFVFQNDQNLESFSQQLINLCARFSDNER